MWGFVIVAAIMVMWPVHMVRTVRAIGQAMADVKAVVPVYMTTSIGQGPIRMRLMMSVMVIIGTAMVREIRCWRRVKARAMVAVLCRLSGGVDP